MEEEYKIPEYEVSTRVVLSGTFLAEGDCEKDAENTLALKFKEMGAVLVEFEVVDTKEVETDLTEEE